MIQLLYLKTNSDNLMIDFLKNGGLLFTIPLTIMLLTVIILTARNASLLFAEKFPSKDHAKKNINYVIHVGLLALSFGLLGQITGLYEGFESIKDWGSVASDYLLTGFAVSSITTLYGLAIFVISYVCWLLLTIKLNRK